MNAALRTFVFSSVLATGISGARALDAASVYAKAKGAVVTVRAGKMDGTGFVTGDGTLVLTCYHVVKGASKIRIDEIGEQPVVLVGVDAKHDVALLALKKPMKNRLEFRAGAAPEPGTKVYAIGTSLGFLDHTLSEGIVSGRREMDGVSYVQITAPLSHGNSGGPVLDEDGRVLGMADFIYEEGQNLNFAVTADHLVTAMASIQAKAAEVVLLPSDKGTIGRLGRAVRETSFFLKADPRSKVVATVGAGCSLVVRKTTSPQWVGVVMSDGTKAFAPAEAVKVLPYEVRGDLSRKSVPRNVRGQAIASLALNLKGSTSPSSGEFVKWAYAQVGYDLPAEPAKQVEVGTKVARYEQLLPGDRVYIWSAAKEAIDQAAIYVGGGYVVMPDAAKGKVTSTYLDEALRKRIVAARRTN